MFLKEMGKMEGGPFLREGASRVSYVSSAAVLKLEWTSDIRGRALKTQTAGPPLPPSLSDSVGLGWGLRICISIKFPGDSAAAGLGRAL